MKVNQVHYYHPLFTSALEEKVKKKTLSTYCLVEVQITQKDS